MVHRVLKKGVVPELGPEVFDDHLAELPASVASRRCADATRTFLKSLEVRPAAIAAREPK
jgi:hypothetical protein